MTTKTTPKISEFETFKSSPYTVALSTKQHTVPAGHNTAVTADGKHIAWYEIPKNKTDLSDPKRYAKVYSGNSLMLSSLPESSTKMFFYIVDNLLPNKDEICIPQVDFNSFYGYKASNRFVYYKAVEGLLLGNVISRKAGSTNTFFVNPDVIFNGDRTKLPNIRVVRPAVIGTRGSGTDIDDQWAQA